MNKTYFLKTRAFSVLEVLMVAVIVAITAGIVISHHRKTVQRARTKEAEAQLEMIYDAEEFYHLNRDEYTDDEDELGLDIPESSYFSYNIEVSGGSFTATARYGSCVMTIDSSGEDIDKSGCEF